MEIGQANVSEMTRGSTHLMLWTLPDGTDLPTIPLTWSFLWSSNSDASHVCLLLGPGDEIG